MVVVAVAGGTGNVGRTIVEALLATAKHEVLILGRKINSKLSTELGVPIIAVDYTDVDALAKILEDNKIDVVISALTMLPSPNGDGPYEIELIRAADKSVTTKRFISSDWTFPVTENIDICWESRHIPKLSSVKPKLEAEEELKNATSLETTKFYNGYFLDYWGLPKVKSHMPPMTLVLDIPHNMAAIPGIGDVPVVFTHTRDVARFVASSLDLKKWEPRYYIVGDRMTWNNFLHIVEEVKGTTFAVVHDSLEKLDQGEVTELPGHRDLYQILPKEICKSLLSTFGFWFADGSFNLQPEVSLNDIFPEIKTLTVREMIEEAWR
ncbi:hypothetical protein FANTH_14679 [Fusarium anthophilum]|uniref:NmrA-like domain-containing protein n=1 Tax=Fusarium anthophilum TaxID=48485 RepID=A0A8H4YGP2_9HYPO|nr:hypothetical protein FANTH_14679 [Fusarium anthophilum]